MRKRRTFSGQAKAQVVLEVLTGVKGTTQVYREHDIKETLLSRWWPEFEDAQRWVLGAIAPADGRAESFWPLRF